MRYVLLVVSLFFSACYQDYNFVRNTNKLVPSLFIIKEKVRMDKITFDTQKFSFKLPTSKESDFTHYKRWDGGSSRMGNDIGVSIPPYHISVSTDYHPREYGENERALENGTKVFHEEKITSRGHTAYINMHIEHHGKENYLCVVGERIERWKGHSREKYKKSYGCYKFNEKRTKYKEIYIKLSYSKPFDPILAQEYTYEDLKRRAKRMLDSLVIKDKW